LKGHGKERLVLVVNQFEELWTQAPADENAQRIFREQQQTPFINLLLAAASSAGSPIKLILTMRADFLHRAAEHREFADIISQHLSLISPMNRTELQRAIELPAREAGGSFEPGLVDELIDQVDGEPGCLPLLQFTLFELWKEAQASDGYMTFEAYQNLGRVKGALAKQADRMLATKSADDRKRLRDILLQLVQPGDGAADTRRCVPLADIVPVGNSAAHVQALIEPLVEARLLTKGLDAHNQETVEISHEALIRNWPTMREWIDQARTDLRLQLQLGEAAREWHANDENPGFLWSQVRLNTIDSWRERANPQLTGMQERFLAASQAEVERLTREREEQRRKEEQLAREQHAGRQLRYLRQAAGIAVGTGFGYGLALTYIAAEDRPFPVLVILFFAFFLPGALVGFSIGLALWRWSSDQARKRLATAVFIILARPPEGLISAASLLRIATGTLLGLGLGLGASFTQHKGKQFVAIVLLSLLMGTLGLTISGTAPSIVSAIVASGLIGSLAGIGLYVVAFEQDNSAEVPEVAHAQVVA
jgi:hypothetical protein